MSLVEDAKAAKEAGLTYGQYMLKKPFEPYHRASGKKCKNCGGILHGRRLNYCCNECREKMKTKTSRGDLFV